MKKLTLKKEAITRLSSDNMQHLKGGDEGGGGESGIINCSVNYTCTNPTAASQCNCTRTCKGTVCHCVSQEYTWCNCGMSITGPEGGGGGGNCDISNGEGGGAQRNYSGCNCGGN